MKEQYYDQTEPDADDALLKEAIAAGVVPSGCLNGGVMVAELANGNEDPCSFCAGPRDRCGGRPMREDMNQGVHMAAALLGAVGSREAKARKMLRKSQIDAIMLMTKQPPRQDDDEADDS